MIRVLLVDDQPVIRSGLIRILSPEDGFEVVGECADGDEVVEAVTAHKPDVVLMDVRMHRVDGISATRALHGGQSAAPPVLILTTFADDEVVWGTLAVGAAGFVLKDCPAEELIAAVRAVAGGAVWLDQNVATRVLGAVRSGARSRIHSEARTERLTQREHDVLRLMASGATNNEIAKELFVGEATVKSHIGAIFAKLGARDRAAAIVFAYDHGIVVPDPDRSGTRPR